MPDESKRRERQTATGKSDRVVVPMKSGNSDGGKDATPARRSRRAPSALSGGLTVQTRLDRVARRARTHRTERFSNLFHLLDVELMAECFEELNEDRAPGVDGVTKEKYADDLEHKLQSVVERLHRRSYRPQPTRRKMIPKANGTQRPLGIPTTEDKLVQRGLARVLERVYEEDFHPFSFGFRPGRGCHDALKELSRTIGTKKVGYVVEADIKGFLDRSSHYTSSEFQASKRLGIA